jgi:heavy metal sensor kinase
MKPLALRTSLTLVNAAILALLLTALGVGYYRVLARQLDRDATAQLEELTRSLHGYFRFPNGVPTLVYDRSDADESAFIEEASRFYQVFDAATGQLLVQSPALEPLGLHYTPGELQSFRGASTLHDMQTDQGRLRLSSSVMAGAAGEQYLLQVGVPLQRIDNALARFLRLLLWSIPAGLLVAMVAGRWMAGQALAPLARLAKSTHAIGLANLEQRIPLRGAGDELDDVAKAFNGLLDRLGQSVGEMRQFSAALAHELRTPLAALRGEAELALMQAQSIDDYRRTLTSQLEEFGKLTRLINQLLTLARADAGQTPIAREPVDLAALTASVVEQLEPVAQAAGLSMTCEHLAPASVIGDAGWLERMLLNLLDNAIKFTPPTTSTGPGRIRVDITREGEMIRLDVHDTGIGVAADAIPHLFERFYRADPARSSSGGAGVGLALVAWIVERHGATVQVKSTLGAGTTFSVRFASLSSR